MSKLDTLEYICSQRRMFAFHWKVFVCLFVVAGILLAEEELCQKSELLKPSRSFLRAPDLAVLAWDYISYGAQNKRFMLNNVVYGKGEEGFQKILTALINFPTNSLLILVSELGDIPVSPKLEKKFLDVIDGRFLRVRISGKELGTNLNEMVVLRWNNKNNNPFDQNGTSYVLNGKLCGVGTNGFNVVLKMLAECQAKTILLVGPDYYSNEPSAPHRAFPFESDERWLSYQEKLIKESYGHIHYLYFNISFPYSLDHFL